MIYEQIWVICKCWVKVCVRAQVSRSEEIEWEHRVIVCMISLTMSYVRVQTSWASMKWVWKDDISTVLCAWRQREEGKGQLSYSTQSDSIHNQIKRTFYVRYSNKWIVAIGFTWLWKCSSNLHVNSPVGLSKVNSRLHEKRNRH